MELCLADPLKRQQIQSILSDLGEDALEIFLKDWNLRARPDQKLPPGNWQYWLVCAGRGYGKSRLGSETVRQWIKTEQYVNLVGATAGDARDIMIEGESGILACCPKDERPIYIANKALLKWPNGNRSSIFTADRPDRFRGKQHCKVWGDEVASWRYPDSIDQLKLGLRLGKNPQALFTTTPRPIRIIKELIKDPLTYVTRGSTYDNRANLAAAFVNEIVKKYEGTRIGRQELYAEILDDNPNALWTHEQIDRLRVDAPPEKLRRIVVAIDPAVTSTESSAETGIIVAGVSYDDQAYILEDCTMSGSPDAWARRAVRAYDEWKADRIIAEVNNGGDLVEAVIRTVNPKVAYRKVHASRGKTKRAEPIAAIYEQNRAHHVGSFPKLEDQMCSWNPEDENADSPDRMDAAVWALTDLMLKPTRKLLVI